MCFPLYYLPALLSFQTEKNILNPLQEKEFESCPLLEFN